MSEIEGGGGGSVESGGGSGEVSSSSEVSETSVAETGGESSEATQEATTEEAGESGGFDEDTDTTESPEDSAEDYEESDSDEEPDDSQEVGFSEGDDVDNADSQYDDADYENDEVSSGDEDGVGFDDSDDDVNDGIDEDAENETESSDSPVDEDNNESVDETDGYDDDSSESDWDDQENDEDLGETEDYSDEESLEDSTDDVQDDGEAQTEDTDSDVDSDEADGDMDNVGETDGTESDTESDTEDGDDVDDVQDDGEAQTEDTDSDADGDEADGDMDNDGEPDGTESDTESDTEDGDDIDDVQDDSEAQTEDTDSDADGDEADGDMDNDGETDDAETNADEDDDYDEDEDPGELEDYSDEDSDNRDDETTDDSESERDKGEEEQAVEENQEAADRAEDETENADVENADKNVDDAAESENRNPAENGIEQQTESADANSTNEVDTENDASRTGENNNDEAQTDTLDNKEDNSTDTRDQTEEQPDDTNAKMENKADTPEGEDAYRTAMNNMAEYMSEHNYGLDDYAEYSKDPEWYKLNSELQQSLGMEVTPPTPEVAMSNMADYMNEHNYGPDDYSEYSQDPEWQKLNADLQQSLGMEVTTDVSTPSPESGKDVSATELPDNCVMVNASDIDMTYAQGMDSDQFWNHHGNTKEDYMRMAERIPDVQQALDSGKSLDEIKQDPELKDTAHAYFDPENMIKVEQQADGSYSFADDGRHRIAAAQELGYEIPVEVANLPENANASTADSTDMKPESNTAPEDVANKSDISSETRENLGAFDQNKWDSLSQVEKEQAVEKLRDSIAEDLQLENKPNIAYYNNEDPGDYGGYAASNNTIYINRFNMGDAAETADTIAHESRHCWQHERADNPQTEQDYQFKENFDDYVRPEDDFYEYQNQPVEADARDYAQDVKDAIPVSEETPDMDAKQTYEESDHKNNSDAPPSTTGPPEMSNEKTESTQLPDDLDRKVDAPDEKKIAEVNKNISDISEDPSLDSREKAEKIAKELNSIGFDKVDETTVLGFTDQKIEVVQMDGSQELYRRGYDTEGQGDYGYGSWWSEEPMSIDETRNKLAVCESWGNPLTGEYQSKPENGTLALKGTAAPQDTPTKNDGVEHRDGGATQYYIETPNKNWCSKVNQSVFLNSII